MNALVLDGHLKSSLCVVRALGKLGVSVTTASEQTQGLAGWSRYSSAHEVQLSPKTEQVAFLEWLVAWGKQQSDPATLYAFSDASYLTIARHREQLEPYFVLQLPDPTNIEIAFDKSRTYALARRLSIPTISEPAVNEITEWPVVVKPRHSVEWVDGVGVSGTADLVLNQTELIAMIDDIKRTTGEEPIIQTFIAGHEYGVELVAEAGVVLQTFVHKRIRSLSPRGGASVVKETATDSELNQAMIDSATRLMKELVWTGPAMVEFKVNKSTNQPLLMEINGRWWGSLPLAEAAGAQLIKHNEAVLRQAPQPEPATLRVLRTQHWLGDLIHLLRVWGARDPMRSLLYPSRLTALLTFMVSTIFDRGDIWSWYDPAPFFGEFISTIQRRL